MKKYIFIFIIIIFSFCFYNTSNAYSGPYDPLDPSLCSVSIAGIVIFPATPSTATWLVFDNINNICSTNRGYSTGSTYYILEWTPQLPQFTTMCDNGYSCYGGSASDKTISHFRNLSHAYEAVWNGTSFEQLNYNTRIISIIPSSNSNVIPFVSTSTDRSASFDIDLLEYYIATGTPYIITAKLQNNDIASYNYYTGLYNVATTGYATTSFNVSANVPFGNYDLSVSILDNNWDILTSTTSTNITFGSSTNAITFEEIYGASSSDPFAISQIATSSECSITNVTGCFKNAIVWALYPNTEAMNTYQSFISTLKTRVPVGYFYLIKDSISGITATSTSLVFNITIPAHLKQYIFDPLDIGIAGILWIFCVFMFYKRLKDIQL